MKFTPYTFAVSDLFITGVLVLAVIFALCLFGRAVCELFDPCEREFEEPINDAAFHDSPNLAETGIAAAIARLPPGTCLVEIDTAGVLTPPAEVLVHEYRWTGSQIEFVRAVPLHAFDFSSLPTPRPPQEYGFPASSQERVDVQRKRFFATAERLNLAPSGNPLGRGHEF